MAKWAGGRGWRRGCVILALWAVFWPHGAPVWAGALERAMLGKSTVVDLSQPTGDPAAEAPGVDHGIAGAGPTKDRGTRMDATGVLGKERGSVAEIPPRELFVRAVVLNVASKVAQTPDYQVTVEDLRSWERQNGRIPRKSAVLVRTGGAPRWAEPSRHVKQDGQEVRRAPGFSPAAVAFLATERQVRGVGLDVAPPAAGGSDATPPRMPRGVWQLDNLVNLDKLPAKGATLVVAPLRIEAPASPVRVIAILP